MTPLPGAIPSAIHVAVLVDADVAADLAADLVLEAGIVANGFICDRQAARARHLRHVVVIAVGRRDLLTADRLKALPSLDAGLRPGATESEQSDASDNHVQSQHHNSPPLWPRKEGLASYILRRPPRDP